jgi:hypothetical protein
MPNQPYHLARTQHLHRGKRDPRIPILRGFVNAANRTITIFCPWCDRWHTHGWLPDTPAWAIEHRFAHCHAGTPGDDTGYYIGPIQGAHSKWHLNVKFPSNFKVRFK